ncbi:hypothetical protein B0H11DRAFT_1921879 [Mycena galericulata]|nr:hypothetical protein B0H11DRAFT_1921879 [Mycena galericulata]
MRRMLSSGVPVCVGVDGSLGVNGVCVLGASQWTTWCVVIVGRQARADAEGWAAGSPVRGEEGPRSRLVDLRYHEGAGLADREGRRSRMSHPSRLFGGETSARAGEQPPVSLVRKANRHRGLGYPGLDLAFETVRPDAQKEGVSPAKGRFR